MNERELTNKSLADALPDEIKRVQELRDWYLTVPMGHNAAAMMKASIDNAIKVSTHGDVLGMINAYRDLQGYTE